MPFIPLEVFTNLNQGSVTAGGGSAPASGTIETWTVVVTSAFPAVEYGAQQCHVADPAANSEIIAVLASPGGTGTQSWTVQRGAEGTIPVVHAPGFTVIQVTTAGVLANLAYPPWQFPAQAYGAQGDGKIGTGGTGTSGTNTFTDAGASFVNAAAPAGDVGKVILINQGPGSATVGTNPFCGTILAVNSPTSITLSANLGATCASAPYVYGTDDAPAIQAALNAAYAWATTTGNYKAQILFGPQIYMLGALTQTTAQTWAGNPEGPFTYNTHLAIPFTGQYQRKLTLDLIGVGDASGQPFWGAQFPSVEGTRLVSAVFPPSQPDATYGQMSVIGTPSFSGGIGNGGISGGGFANVLVNISGIMLVPPFNSQIYGFDFRYASMMDIDNGSVIVFAPVNYNAQTCGGPWMRYTNIVSNLVGCGLATPLVQNNDNTNIGNFAVMGTAVGLQISEHVTAQRLCTVYCGRCIEVITGGVGGSILYWDAEGSNYALHVTGSTQFALNITLATFELIQTAYVYDTANSLTGTMWWFDLGQSSPAGVGVTGAANYKIVNTRMLPGPWVANAPLGLPAAPAAPASGTASTNAQQNTAYRDATVYCSATGSITATFTGPAATGMTALGQTAGAGIVVPVRVNAGHWFAVTYTGTLTTTWILE